MGDDPAEAHALADEIGADLCARGAGALDGVGANGLQGRRSFRAPAARRGPRPSARSCAARSRTRGRCCRTGRSRNPSETKALATSSPEPPSTGSLWQPKQEFESGPLVRLNGGLTPVLRLVGMIAWVAFGRPAPSTVVNFALNSSRPRSIEAREAPKAPAAATASKSTCEEKDALVPAAAARGAGRQRQGERADRGGSSQASFHVPLASPLRRRISCGLFLMCPSGARKRSDRLIADRRQNLSCVTSAMIAKITRKEQGTWRQAISL